MELKKAVAYTRVARRESSKLGNCIEKQQQVLNDFAAANGYQITANFYDVGVHKPLDREGFQEMLKAIEKSNGGITQILVASLDRITRDYFQFAITEAVLKSTYEVTITPAQTSEIPEIFLPAQQKDKSKKSYESKSNPIISKDMPVHKHRIKTITDGV